MPTQLNVECGKTLLSSQGFSEIHEQTNETSNILFLSKFSQIGYRYIKMEHLPRKFLRKEILHASSPKDLRQGTREPK